MIAQFTIEEIDVLNDKEVVVVDSIVDKNMMDLEDGIMLYLLMASSRFVMLMLVVVHRFLIKLKMKKHHADGILTIFSACCIVKFMHSNGKIETLKGYWCNNK